jgi:hypothetical protein
MAAPRAVLRAGVTWTELDGEVVVRVAARRAYHLLSPAAGRAFLALASARDAAIDAGRAGAGSRDDDAALLEFARLGMIAET